MSLCSTSNRTMDVSRCRSARNMSTRSSSSGDAANDGNSALPSSRLMCSPRFARAPAAPQVSVDVRAQQRGVLGLPESAGDCDDALVAQLGRAGEQLPGGRLVRGIRHGGAAGRRMPPSRVGRVERAPIRSRPSPSSAWQPWCAASAAPTRPAPRRYRAPASSRTRALTARLAGPCPEPRSSTRTRRSSRRTCRSTPSASPATVRRSAAGCHPAGGCTDRGRYGAAAAWDSRPAPPAAPRTG